VAEQRFGLDLMVERYVRALDPEREAPEMIDGSA
jgi:hypothetical protein